MMKTKLTHKRSVLSRVGLIAAGFFMCIAAKVGFLREVPPDKAGGILIPILKNASCLISLLLGKLSIAHLMLILISRL